MCRAFPCAATRLRGIENCDRRLIFGADYISYRQKPCEERRPLNFSRCFLRSNKILLQQCAILRNAPQIRVVGLTYDSQCCATQRKRAQFVNLELQINCSIGPSYRRRIARDTRIDGSDSLLFGVWNQALFVTAAIGDSFLVYNILTDL